MKEGLAVWPEKKSMIIYLIKHMKITGNIVSYPKNFHVFQSSIDLRASALYKKFVIDSDTTLEKLKPIIKQRVIRDVYFQRLTCTEAITEQLLMSPAICWQLRVDG